MPEIFLSFGSSSTAKLSTTGAKVLELSLQSNKIIEKPKDPQRVYAGSVLAPWQSRLANGEWTDSLGNLQKLPINEKNLNNALHGLVFDSEFEILEQSDASVLLATLISPVAGYPYSVELKVKYELNNLGFVCEFSATNLGDSAAPFAIGFHPYFAVEDPGNSTLSVPAKSYYTQDEQKIPKIKKPVLETNFDFSNGKSLLGLKVDDYFTDLEVTDGEILSKLDTPNWTIEIIQSSNLRHLVIYYMERYQIESGVISAVALEPASAPGNAFNNKQDLVLLRPRDTFTGNWKVRLAQ
jgi:aldose 1-epimerase